MPSIVKSVSLTTGTNSDNALAGSAFEYMRGPGIVSCAVTTTAAGAFVTINSGPDIVLEESPVPINAAWPVIPDQFYFNWGAAAGDRLVVRLRNPTGGTLVFIVVVNVQYTR